MDSNIFVMQRIGSSIDRPNMSTITGLKLAEAKLIPSPKTAIDAAFTSRMLTQPNTEDKGQLSRSMRTAS